MSKGNTFENDVVLLTFNGTAFSWNANTNLFVSLHTADPGEAGTQTTSEATYTSYARLTVARTAGGFTVTGNSVANTALVQFPQCTGGTNTVTHFAVGTVTSGVGQILYKGALNASLAVSNGIQPQFAAAALTVTED